MNRAILHNWSTPATIGTGVIVTLTGVLMFLGLHQPLGTAHEWLGILFSLAVVLHILKHQRSFKRYFSQHLAQGIFIFSGVAGISLMVLSMTQGDGVLMNLIHTIEGAPLAVVAPLMDQDAAELLTRLSDAGIEVDTAARSLNEIAAANHLHPKELLGLLFN